MIYKKILLPHAFQDIKEINLYYKSINDTLAKKFNDNLKAAIKMISKNPILFQIRYDNFRVSTIKDFPFIIHYEISENTIIIKAIYHSSRDSKLNLF
jgi:plasmid stabilization system protein ParE